MAKARVIIANWNGAHFLRPCLADLERQTFRDFAVTVVDNGSTDDSHGVARASALDLDWIRLERNVGFASANNIAIRRATEPFVALLNNDVRLSPGWLAALIARALDADRPAAVGSLVLDEAGERIFSAGEYLTRWGHVLSYGHGRRVGQVELETDPTSVAATACLYESRALHHVGCFDEHFFAYHEDVDLCLRLRLAGHSLALEPDALVYHVGHGTAGTAARFEALGVRNLLLLALGTLPRHLLASTLLPTLVTVAGDVVVLTRRHGLHWAAWVVASWLTSGPHVLRKRRFVRRITRNRHALDDSHLHVPPGPRSRWTSLPLGQLRRGAR